METGNSKLPDRSSKPALDYSSMPLTPAQRSVVEMPSLDRHVLITAPPGSGKTLAITRRIAHLLAHGLASADHILALTFTERAANELATRLEAMTLPGVASGTFHGRCSAILREHRLEAGLRTSMVLWNAQQQQDRMRIAASQCGLGRMETPQLSRCLRALSRKKCSRLGIADVAKDTGLNESLIAELFERYELLMDEEHAVDFDDLIIRIADMLWKDPEVARRIHNRYHFVFIDEFQDVSPEQHRLLHALAPPAVSGRQVVVVADENQAIFGFRGADPQEMLAAFRRDYQPYSVRFAENHRSVIAIVAAANSLMRAGGRGNPSNPTREPGLRIDAFETRNEVQEAAIVVGLIERAMRSGYRPEQIAVLYRKHQRVEVVAAALIHAGIGVHRVSKDHFYDQQDVQEIVRYFELVASSQERSFVNAVNWPRFLVDELTMIDLRVIAGREDIGLGELAERQDLLRSMTSAMTATAVERFMSDVVIPVRERGAWPVRDTVGLMLDLLHCRRDPIGRTRREDFRSVLDELGKNLAGCAGTLDRALARKQPLALLSDGTQESEMAAALIERVAGEYFRHSRVSRAGDDPGALRIAIGREGEGCDIHIPPASDARPVSATATAWRMLQMTLMRRERLGDRRFVVLDFETTSDRVDSAEILEIGAVVVEHGEIQPRRFTARVRPSSPDAITLDAFNVHGIRWEDVAQAPPPDAVLPELLDFIGSATIAGHSIQRFDALVLRKACERAGLTPPDNPLFDTLLAARRLRPGAQNALDDLLTSEERQLRKRHGALLDAELTAAVLLRIVNMIEQDREIDALSEELPVVAASILLTGLPESADLRLLIEAGAKALQLGDGPAPLSKSVQWLKNSVEPVIIEELNQRSAGADPGDVAWKRLRAGWDLVIDAFESTAREQSLAALVDFVRLAAPDDLEPTEAGRVSLMTVYSAKGHEWPVVLLIGVEDDQYPYTSNAREQEVEEGRRALYVGMTRASERLFLTWARSAGDRDREPSRFLSDFAEHMVVHGKTRGVHR